MILNLTVRLTRTHLSELRIYSQLWGLRSEGCGELCAQCPFLRSGLWPPPVGHLQKWVNGESVGSLRPRNGERSLESCNATRDLRCGTGYLMVKRLAVRFGRYAWFESGAATIVTLALANISTPISKAQTHLRFAPIERRTPLRQIRKVPTPCSSGTTPPRRGVAQQTCDLGG